MLSEIDDDRDERGILSRADREYLRNPEEYSRQAANARQRRIVERTRNALLDFRYLADPEFSDELLLRAFAAPPDLGGRHPLLGTVPDGASTEIVVSDPEVEASAAEAITTFHRIYPPELFNSLVEDGVVSSVNRFQAEKEVVDASYSPDIRDREKVHERAREKLESDIPLTAEETKLLLEYGEVDPDRVVEHVRGSGDD